MLIQNIKSLSKSWAIPFQIAKKMVLGVECFETAKTTAVDFIHILAAV